MNTGPISMPTHLPPAVHAFCASKRGRFIGPQANSTLLLFSKPMEVSPNFSEPMDVSLSSRTATAVNSGSTPSSAPPTTPWFDKTVEDFCSLALQTKASVEKSIDSFVGEVNWPFLMEVKESALKQVDSLQERVVQHFTEHGGDSWQSCMDWLIRLTPEVIGSRELLNLLPVELIRSRPDLPEPLADQAQTIEQLAAKARLCVACRTGVAAQGYRGSSVNSNDVLEIYLKSTSTLRYCFLQAALQRAPLQEVEALLRHWLHDDACKDIAALLSAAPIHPTLITCEEPFLQDLLTLCATRLLQPTRCQPVKALVPEAHHSLLATVARCHNKVIFGRTIGAIGGAGDDRNLYLKCRRFDEQESDFMAEPVMLSWLGSAELSLESATVEPHGITTFRTLQSLLQQLHLNAKQKTDLVCTVVYKEKCLMPARQLATCLAKHSPGSAAAWHAQYCLLESRGNPYRRPCNILTAQQLADFLLNLPFGIEHREAVVDDLLPGLDRTLRRHIVHKSSATLNDEQCWQLVQTLLPADTLSSPVTAYLFSTPPEAHYHRYVTDCDLHSAASQPLAKRPQVVALRAYLRDYGRLFHQGVLGPPACNLFHNAGLFTSMLYRFIYTRNGLIRPGRICDFDGDSSNYPNIGPAPMTLRDGGDSRCITAVGEPQALYNNPTELAKQLPVGDSAEDKEPLVESLACAWLGTVLLLGRTLKACTDQSPEGWFNSCDAQKENELADLLGEMVVDLFSHSFAVDPTTLHARLCQQDDGKLIERCAREMQAWMSDAFRDHIVAKEVPVWLYPHYTGRRDNLLIPSEVTDEIRNNPPATSKNHNLGLPYATLPLQGIEILTKKALAESVLLGSQKASATFSPLAHGKTCEHTNLKV